MEKTTKKEKGIIFDLKNFRSNFLNGMSQEAFAEKLGVSQDKVSRMEAHPEDIDVDMLCKISSQFGIDMNSLVSVPKSEFGSQDIEYTWSSAEAIRKILIEYIKNHNISETYSKDVDELNNLVRQTIRKPKVAFIGRSDTGKSTIINFLLRTEKLPAKWTPTTSVAVFIKHINDRPAYMDEDVWIFHSDGNGEIWNDSKLSEMDEDYCRSLRICSGNYDLLNDYGTRQGEHFADNKATAAVVFIDSKLLLDCDVVDLPGYGTGDRVDDDSLSLKVKNKADVFVYLSLANGFMRNEDMIYIREAIPNLANIDEYGIKEINPLDNLFIVASQAHTVSNGNLSELNNILADGCKRFENILTDDFWYKRAKPENLLDRFYYFSTNSPEHYKQFEKDFYSLVEKLPRVIEENTKRLIDNWVSTKDQKVQNEIARYQQMLDDRKKSEDTLNEYVKNEPVRCARMLKSKQEIVDSIYRYNLENKDELDRYYDNVLNEDNLVSLMEARKVKNKKSEIQEFSSYVSSLLQGRLSKNLSVKSEQLAEKIKNYLESFKDNTILQEVDKGNFVLSTFDTTRVFASGLTGLATYGGLAAWAASCGHLGGYILVTKGVSLLASIGIHVGGTAAAVATVAAIGGPVVLGIALAVTAALAAFGISSIGWKKRIAKKIVSIYAEKKVLRQLKNQIDIYWKDTHEAFNIAADKLNSEWEKHLDTLRAELNNYDEGSIRKAIEEAKEMRNFLQDMPGLIVEKN